MTDGLFMVQKRGIADSEESIQILSTRKIPVEAPKVEEKDTIEGGVQKGRISYPIV